MTIRIAAVLLATVATLATLAACGNATPEATATATADPDAKTARGTGTVTEVDAAAGRITLDHLPIPEVGWPAMHMTFAAPPEALAGVKPGDKVAFDLAVSRGNGVITALEVQ